jgi:hypothetical protein
MWERTDPQHVEMYMIFHILATYTTHAVTAVDRALRVLRVTVALTQSNAFCFRGADGFHLDLHRLARC